MKKLLSILFVSAMIFSVSAKDYEEPELPKTTPTVLDDFEDGMYFNAIRDGWNDFGNTFMVKQFSTASKTTKSWTGKGSCGELSYAALPGNKEQSCIYECTDLIENNWTSYGWISVVVNNPNDYPVTVQMFTSSGENWAWGNTDAPTIPTGTHTLLFKLNTNVVKEPKQVQKVGISFFIGGKLPEGKVYIDDVTLWSKK